MDNNAQEAFDAYQKYGSQVKAAEALGLTKYTFKKRLNEYYSDPNEATLHRNCLATRTPVDDVAYYWIKTGEVSMMVRRSGGLSYEEIRDNLVAEVSKHAPVYPKLTRTTSLEDHLLVVDLADVHIGKLAKKEETGDDYGISKAVQRVLTGTDSLLEKAQGFKVGKILLVIGNDILHTDTPHRKTTGGTPQDTEGQWWEMFLEAKKCYVTVIERLTELADVHIVFCPSNHDYVSGWMLADTLSSWFRNHPNVSFGKDNRSVSIAHRKYVEYGANLLGFTHGDGAKEKDLPSLMQYEAREAWGRTKFAYIYQHHTHHKTRLLAGKDEQKLEKDNIGVTVLHRGKPVKQADNVYIETIRSPSPADGWHDRNGYKNMQAVEAFLHHPELGQVARLTHWF